MKKIIFFTIFSFLFFACKKKKDDTIPAFVWPDGTGEYAPYTLNSTFVYETSSVTGTDSFTYTVTKDTVLDGLKCRKLESSKPNLANTLYVNYGNGIRTDFILNSSFNGFNIPLIKQELLKEATPINGTWTGSFNVSVPAMPPTIPIPLTVPVTFTYTMLQKDFVKNILAKDYANTYAVKQVGALPASVIAFLPAGTPSSVTVDNYFSKGVGISQKDATGTSFKIKRYNIIK